MTTLHLEDDELEVLRLLLEFHADDEPEEFYPFAPYHFLCVKAGVVTGETYPTFGEDLQKDFS